ncbi:MAG: hypothetical protein NUV48_07145 [Peptococcaceae bacterium]|nr:hypothetical protein [Peptococcaceae bacterium]
MSIWIIGPGLISITLEVEITYRLISGEKLPILQAAPNRSEM